MTKKRVGEIVQEHNEKNIQFEDDVREYSRVMCRDNWEEIQKFAAETALRTEFKNRDFYVVFIINNDPMLMEPKFIIDRARFSCPTPRYKDTVFKYHHVSGELEYLWHLPDKGKCKHIMKHAKKYFDNPETKALTQFVVAAESGDLLKWVLKENGELPDAIIKFNNVEESGLETYRKSKLRSMIGIH